MQYVEAHAPPEMGYGDEIIGSGLARGAHARGKKIAFGDGRKILWSEWCKEVYENNPNVAHPGQERLPNLEWIAFHKGSRNYSTLSNDRSRWIWNYKHRMVAGEFFFSEIEQALAATFAPGFIVIEPNLPWHKSVAVNKDWGESKYAELARRLLLQGYRLLQFKHSHSRRLIAGADIVQLPRFREAIAVMTRAAMYVGTEGGMMHAAAAVGIKAAVLFGGWSPPIVCGYPGHVNLVGNNGAACGSLHPCKHCQQALANISVDQVKDAVVGQLYHDNEMRNRSVAK